MSRIQKTADLRALGTNRSSGSSFLDKQNKENLRTITDLMAGGQDFETAMGSITDKGQQASLRGAIKKEQAIRSVLKKSGDNPVVTVLAEILTFMKEFKGK